MPNRVAGQPLRYNVLMAFTCNIDRRGRIARLIYGLVLIAIAAVLAFGWALRYDSVGLWIITVSCAVAGAFGIFEGLKGWCVMRAMGFKTPM
jgi:hypothetical protein